MAMAATECRVSPSTERAKVAAFARPVALQHEPDRAGVGRGEAAFLGEVHGRRRLLQSPVQPRRRQRPGPPAACSTSAAHAAASGAAALVPKKFGRPLPSASKPKKVVSTPSAAVICGTRRISGAASRLPCVVEVDRRRARRAEVLGEVGDRVVRGGDGLAAAAPRCAPRSTARPAAQLTPSPLTLTYLMCRAGPSFILPMTIW